MLLEMQDHMVTFRLVTIGYLQAIPIHTGTGIQPTTIGIQATTVGIQAIIIHIVTTITRATTIIHIVTNTHTPMGLIIGIRTHTTAITGGIGDLTGSNH